jgi:glycosyltransferase involved in cell wall biosynthesis
MSIIIFGDLFTFPEGKAATNRVYTYAKGFYENGINVHVISFENEYLTVNDGIIDGINFYHPYGQEQRNKYFINRRFKKLIKYFKAIKLIKRISRKEKIIAINIWTNLLSTYLFAWLLAKISNTKLIIECSEHPLRNYQTTSLIKKIGILKFYIESKLCDGVFCISQFLIDFHKNHQVNQRKLFLVPSTVDPVRFSQNGKSPFPHQYIGYFGGLTFERDNIDSLISAFDNVCISHPEVHLILGGFCSEKVKKQIKNLISQLKMPSKVHLLEYLTRQEVTRYIINADILIMVRANDLKAQASFPSKLTEFLATSKPVVTVNVGEISDYLTDGVNAYIVEPENSISLGKKLNYVLNNYELAKNVGLKGKELTDTIFNYNYQAKRMIGFINSLYIKKY